MRCSSGLFHVHINAKSVNKFPTGKRKFTPPSFGKECKRQCREDAAANISPATLSPNGAIAPNVGCITTFFFLIYDGGGITYFVWEMKILFVRQYSFVYSKKSI